MRIFYQAAGMSYPHDPSIWLKELFINARLNYHLSAIFSTTSLVLIVLFLSWLSNVIAKALIRTVVTRVVRKTTFTWDDIFLEQKVFTRLSHFAPALVIWFMAGWALKDYPIWLIAVRRFTYTYMLVVGAVVINTFIEAWYQIYLTLPISQHRSIKGYVQIVKIIVIVVFSLLIFSVIFNKQVSTILAGLGVMASVLILVFKDAILGLVASLQLSSNKMVKVGDWITIPGREIDGEVADITLTTVKVRNFDKTILTVPTYSLVNESFQNWVGMEESGVRLIKRAFFIDMKSIRFADQSLLDKIDKEPLFKEYFEKAGPGGQVTIKEKDKSVSFTSGRLTNLGIFRMYAESYLRDHPMIDKSQTILVRHQSPEENGMPLQVYAFTNQTDFVTYENAQSEIFEHLLAMINEFGLKVFQQPSEYNLLSVSETK
ncbi:MAG: mechanosensitive ion channel domain-containing protein [Bacteroidales bacterium]